MNLPEKNNEIVFFKPESGQTEFQVVLDGENDTVWANQGQLVELFGKAKGTISEHLKNIFESGELDKNATVRDFRTVQTEGDRKVQRSVTHYNLDVIISLGYRVNSKVGIEFRKWATSKLKEYLIQGYSINQELLKLSTDKIKNLELHIDHLNETVFQNQKQITDGFLSIIGHYSKSFELLNQYDTEKLSMEGLNADVIYRINYEDVKKAIQELKKSLIQKGEASQIFGNEKDKSFEGILGSVSQTVFGQLAYPTVEEQAAQLLYSIIKGHAFSDGNKRIGSFIFVWFLEQNNYHLKEKGKRKIDDNTLVALALAVAQSLPEQRELIIKLIINLIKN